MRNTHPEKGRGVFINGEITTRKKEERKSQEEGGEENKILKGLIG